MIPGLPGEVAGEAGRAGKGGRGEGGAPERGARPREVTLWHKSINRINHCWTCKWFDVPPDLSGTGTRVLCRAASRRRRHAAVPLAASCHRLFGVRKAASVPGRDGGLSALAVSTVSELSSSPAAASSPVTSSPAPIAAGSVSCAPMATYRASGNSAANHLSHPRRNRAEVTGREGSFPTSTRGCADRERRGDRRDHRSRCLRGREYAGLCGNRATGSSRGEHSACPARRRCPGMRQFMRAAAQSAAALRGCPEERRGQVAELPVADCMTNADASCIRRHRSVDVVST